MTNQPNSAQPSSEHGSIYRVTGSSVMVQMDIFFRVVFSGVYATYSLCINLEPQTGGYVLSNL